MLSGTFAVPVAGFLPIATAQSSVGEYTRRSSRNAIALLASWLAAVVVVPHSWLPAAARPRAPRHSSWLAKRFRA